MCVIFKQKSNNSRILKFKQNLTQNWNSLWKIIETTHDSFNKLRRSRKVKSKINENENKYRIK